MNGGGAIGTRTDQRNATRSLLVDTAVELHVALLHHFPTRDDLLGALIRRLLELHEDAACEALARTITAQPREESA